MNKWAEIRCEFYDEIEKKYSVDAWKSADDNEEGIVIAKIDPTTKEIEYLDNEAKTDEYAQEIINSVMATL